MGKVSRYFVGGMCIVVPVLYSPLSYASDLPSREAIDVVWLATAAALVFFMQAGFALLESGLSRSKNCINVVMKNYTDVCIGSLVFWAFGFGLMFGVNNNGLYGTSGFMLAQAKTWDYSFLLFQTMFAATAATIASGAMAERAKFSSYVIISVIITGFIYPVFGSWAWGSYYQGQGWLREMGFIDFAGSSVVHSVGGWSALAAIMILGPRLGRFSSTGKARDIPGHNLNYVALGGFILWLGWFGFNGGSTVSADVSIGLINLNTHLAAASGALASVILGQIFLRAVTVVSVINGSLAGLVGITAGCATMEPHFAILTGVSSAAVAFSAERLLVKMGLDDVVGAVSVHAVAGAWGTLCAGMFVTGDLFNTQTMLTQLIGVAACFGWSFGGALILFKIVDLIRGLRVDSIHEQRGLDYTEHAEVAYPEFIQQTFYSKSNLEGVKR